MCMPSSLGADPWSSVMLGAAPVNIARPGISVMPTAGSLTDRRSTKEKDSWVCFVWLAGPVKKEKIIMKEKHQASSNKLRHFVAGQFGKLTQSQASSNKLRHLVLFHKPGTKIKNRFRRKI